ncbi:serine protease [Rhodospira trueperi]|uniref:Trypsin-like peptidase domain-containing protein n=1 Tax=Rhodospira trueperi TaxID=69960 RepID=A0A1G7HNG7_9PROT|nr:serine protease [Rhodospira trueperi]SDF02010.1 hypothetical protein SAMN05421720_12318 [Rhodospira trueperi]
MTWKDTLVAIWAPTTDGKGEIGTGFPIARDLLMTARHVVRSEDRDKTKPLEINWLHSRESWSALCSDDDKLIIWECDVHDVAVLKATRPADVEGVCLLSPTRPCDGAIWSGAGFSGADTKNGVQEAGHFCGRVMSMAEKDAFFQISAIETSPDTEAGWCGASGMSILVNERVIGVCCELPANYAGKKVSVAPVWQLWKSMGCHESIRDALPIFGVVEQLRKKLIDVIGRIRLPDDVMDYILGRIAQNKGFGVSEMLQSNEKKVHTLVDAISDMTPSEVFGVFGSHAISENGDLDEHIFAFVQAIAPYLFAANGTEVSVIIEKARSGGALVTDVPIATHTMAEIVVAAAQNRSVQFLARQAEHDLPPGAKLIPFRPFFRNDDQSGVMSAIIEELRHQYPKSDSINGLDFEAGIVNNLSRSYRVENSIDRISAVKIRMSIDKKRGGSLPYMAFILSDNENERGHILASVRNICETLPDLTAVVLDPRCLDADLQALSSFP